MTAFITRNELNTAIEQGAITVLDALPASYYEQAHIPGALNLVESDVRELPPSLVPETDAAIVTYCSNAACNNSQAVANLLENLGYTNVRKYKCGIQDWSEAGLPIEGTSTAARA